MENASKALLIAAAVLVVIILVAVGMKIYSSTTDAQKSGINTGKTISDKTSDAKDLAISEITGKKVNKNIKYYNSNNEIVKQEDVQLGYDIVIGETERFKVFSIENNKIKAIPYYNLKLDSDPIKQATDITAGECKFSDRVYWKYDENGSEIPNWNANAYGNVLDLDMNKSYIQHYVDKYSNTLGSDINVKIPTVSDLSNIKNVNLNYTKSFWTGSCNTEVLGCVYYCRSDGTIGFGYYSGRDGSYGVRPIIIIPK